jgi:hypothetical protein
MALIASVKGRESVVLGSKLKIIAVIEEPAVIERILTRAGLAAPPPRAPVRLPELIGAA